MKGSIKRLYTLVHNIKYFAQHNAMQPIQPIKSKLRIVEKTTINHDCYIYLLEWAGPSFPLTIGQHFRIVETIPTFDVPEGEEVIRKYTPISPCSQKVFQNST